MRFLTSFASGQKTSNRLRRQNRRAKRRVLVETLEDRRLLAAYVVNTNLDVVDDTDGLLSLREAMQAADTNMAFNEAGAGDTEGDTITFNLAAGFEVITLTGGSLLSPVLIITDDLVIDGDNALGSGVDVTIDGDGVNQIFSIDIDSAKVIDAVDDVTLRNLTLQNAIAPAGVAGGAISDSTDGGIGAFDHTLIIRNVNFDNNQADRGGAIRASGDNTTLTVPSLDIDGASFTDNTATDGGSGGNDGSGGAVFIGTDSETFVITAFITNATFTGNSADGVLNSQGGGAIYVDSMSTLIIDDSGGDVNIGGALAAEANTAQNGGGIFSAGTLIIDDTTSEPDRVIIGGNSATRAGGGIEIFSGSAVIDGSYIGIRGGITTGNTAGVNGGGIHVSDGTLDIDGGTAPVFIRGNSAAEEGGGIWINTGDALTIDGDVEINFNTASGALGPIPAQLDQGQGGGGIFNNGGSVTIFNSGPNPVLIDNNTADGTAGSGGGIFNNAGGTLTITGATITNNLANRAGGGIEDASDSGLGVTLTDVLLEDNNAGVAPAVAAPGNGGGLHITGAGDAMIIGSTVSGNSAALEGGGLWNGGGTMTIDGGTVSFNIASGDAADDGGGGIFNNGGTVELLNSVNVIDNVANGLLGSGGGIFNAGTLTEDGSGNVISGNTAERAGGGIEHASSTTLTLTNVTLDDNTARGFDVTSPGNGGGLHITGSADSFITGGTVNGNFAAEEGGGLWNGSGTMTIAGTTIDNNASAGNGTDQGGGGLFNAGGTIEIDNATITNNLASGGIVVSLDGTQEVPPVVTAVTGEANFQYDAVNGTFRVDLFVAGLTVADLTASPVHIHIEEVGVNGPIVVDFGALGFTFNDFDGGIRLLAEDVPFPPASEAELLAGNAYFNVHTTANMSGEVRGQINIPATMGSGGGILNDQGTINVIGGSITGNVASRAGGGIETNVGSTTLTNVMLDNNIAGPMGLATPGNGGGLHATGAASVDIVGGTVNGNSAALEGGGLWNDGGTMTVDGTTIAGNTASGDSTGGGGIHNDGGTLNVRFASITDNSADGPDGTGGGIFNVDSGTLSITDSTISGNTAASDGGGINHSSDGAIAVSRSTVSGNFAGGSGGGVFTNTTGVGELINSTISGNSANVDGGGIVNYEGTLTAIHSTIAGNRSDADGDATGTGGGIWTFDDTLTDTNLFNTIVAGNVSGAAGLDAFNDIAEKDIATGSANNLISDPASAGGLAEGTDGNLVGDGSGGLLGLDEILDPVLAVNGGPTLTHALVTDSRAIDGGDNAFSTTGGDDGIPGTTDTNETPLVVDQRGDPFDREVGANVDIGAYERQTLAASDLIVTTLADELDFVGDVSLREAINRAEGSIGSDTITFDPALMVGGPATITLTMGELVITDSVSIDGPGADRLTISGDNISRVFNFGGAGANTFTISNLTIANGDVGTADGGAILMNDPDDTLNVTRSVIRDSIGDGAISVVSGSLAISDSTVHGNLGDFAGGLNLQNVTAATLTNTTISGNTATTQGSGIHHFASGTDATSQLTILNSTIANNSSPLGSNLFNGTQLGAISSTVEFQNSIFALPQGGGENFFNTGTGATLTSLGNNLSDDATGDLIGSDLANTDPMLEPLARNGGTTPTHAIPEDSPARDAGNSTVTEPNDQRGAPFLRDDGGGVDIGAYELQILDASFFVVTTETDELDYSNAGVSLREAVNNANGSPGVDQITFDAAVTNAGLVMGELVITSGAMITGNGQATTTVDAGGNSRVMFFDGPGDLTVTGITITGGQTTQDDETGDGAGIQFLGAGTLTVSDSDVSGNTILGDNAYGGGLYSAGDLTLTGSTVSGNQTNSAGGGIFAGATATVTDSTISGNSAANAGGIQVIGGLSLTGSTISGNTASESGGGVIADGTTTILNSTISGNTAALQGGGLRVADGSTTNIINTTITANNATDGGGVYGYDGGGTSVTIENSIVAANTSSGTTPDVFVPATIANSLIGDREGTIPLLAESQTADPTTGNIVGTSTNLIDPMLGPLEDNGGLTFTHALLAGSPAIDAGSDALVPAGTDFDQRGTGFARIVGVNVDMGAFEVQSGNQKPTFTASDPPAVLEDTGAQTFNGFVSNFDPGDPSESSQTVLAYIVSDVTNAALFSTLPAVDTSGNLTYTLADDAFGSSDFSVAVQDSGGTANGGIDTSDPQTFTITVDGINDAPSFTAVATTTVPEDAGPQTVNDFATFDPGNTFESAQIALAYTVSNVTNMALFSVLPAIDASGNLTFTPADNAFGTSEFTVVVQDDGGTDNGGVDTSTAQTLTITVTPVNDAPTFTATDPPTVAQDAGAQTVTGFAIFDPGNTFESAQMVMGYTVSGVTNPTLFSVEPAIDDSGNLTYTPAAGVTGMSDFTVVVQDDGGTADGGVDTSAAQTFTITVAGATADPVINISPTGPNGAPDPDDLPSGPQPTSWAEQRSDLRRIVIDLGAPITTVSASDLVLTNLGLDGTDDPGTVIPLRDDQLTLSTDGLQIEINLDANQLPDGVYQLELLAGITGGETFTFTGDSTNKFYVLTGDWNGSGGVNIQDFATFAYWFGRLVPDVAPDYVDTNNSGGINVQDFAGFAANFGLSIFPEPAPLTAGGGEGELESVLRTLFNPTDVDGDGSITAFAPSQDGKVSSADALFEIPQLVDGPLVSQIASVLQNLKQDDELLVALADQAGPELLTTLANKVSSILSDPGAIDAALLEGIDPVLSRYIAQESISLDEVIELLADYHPI